MTLQHKQGGITHNDSANNPAKKDSSLGRGLQSLFGDETSMLLDRKEMTNLPTSRLIPGKFQPRQTFSQETIDELAISIEKHGILHPLLVRMTNEQDDYGNKYYEIIAGERRLRAAKKIGMKRVPVVIKTLTDSQAAEGSLIENIQRQDLNPLEEAQAYQRLINEFQYRHEDLSSLLGKSRSYISNMLRLLKLSDASKKALSEGQITLGHCKVLLGCDDENYWTERVIAESLSVRSLESLLNREREKSNGNQDIKQKTKGQKTQESGNLDDPDVVSIENLLSEEYGRRVKVIQNNNHTGAIIFYYKNAEDFDALLERISNSSNVPRRT